MGDLMIAWHHSYEECKWCINKFWQEGKLFPPSDSFSPAPCEYRTQRNHSAEIVALEWKSFELGVCGFLFPMNFLLCPILRKKKFIYTTLTDTTRIMFVNTHQLLTNRNYLKLSRAETFLISISQKKENPQTKKKLKNALKNLHPSRNFSCLSTY